MINVPNDSARVNSPAPGIYAGVPDAEYRAWPYPSQSGIKRLLQSPAHYRQAMDHPEPSTAAQQIGSALDCWLLERHRWADLFCIRPEGLDGRTKEGKAWLAEHADRVCVPAEDWTFIQAAEQAIAEHPAAQALFHESLRQVSVVWDDRVCGVRCKGRLDMLQLAGALGPAIADLKKAREGDGSPATFRYAARRYGLDVQAAMYADAISTLLPPAGEDEFGRPFPMVVPFYLLVVEQAWRPLVTVHRMSDRTLALGRGKYRKALETYKTCTESGEWPAYPTDVLDLDLWGRDEEMEAFA